MKIRKLPNYNHETMDDAGYSEMKRIDKKSVYLWNASTDVAEVWIKSPNYAGYAVIINDVAHEFSGTNSDIRFCDECNRWEEK